MEVGKLERDLKEQSVKAAELERTAACIRITPREVCLSYQSKNFTIDLIKKIMKFPWPNLAEGSVGIII